MDHVGRATPERAASRTAHVWWVQARARSAQKECRRPLAVKEARWDAPQLTVSVPVIPASA